MIREWVNELVPVPVERWGADHWSTLAYAETAAVDGDGHLDARKMRCDRRLHSEFAHANTPKETRPTRLVNGDELKGHDDWSCLEDIAKAGLLRVICQEFSGRGPRKANVILTDLGWEIAGALRKFKALGGRWADFVYKEGVNEGD